MKNWLYIVFVLVVHLSMSQTIEHFNNSANLTVSAGGVFSYCNALSCGSADIFDVTSDPNLLDCVAGEVGGRMFAAVDLNACSSNNSSFIVNLYNPPSNNGTLTFKGLIASLSNGLEASDGFTIDYSIDGAPFVTQTTFSGNTMSTFINSEFDVFDNTFSEYTFDFPGINHGGKTVQIRISFSNMTSGGEGVAFDEFEITHPSTCVAPLTQASNLSLSQPSLTSYSVNWTNGSGDRTLVTARLKSKIGVDPFNSVDYSSVADNNFGTAGSETFLGSENFVVYDGTGSSCTVLGLSSSDKYTFSVYSYNSADNCYNLDEVFASPSYVDDNSNTNDVFTSTSIAGDNSNNGTSSAPYETLTYALSIACEGDMIFVDAGTYDDVNMNLSLNNLYVIGAGTDYTIFDNNNAGSDANRWGTVTGDNITIQDLYITGYNYGVDNGIALQISGAQNLIVNNVFTNENFPGGGSSGIVINGGATAVFNGGGSNCNPAALSVAGGGVNVEGSDNIIVFNDYSFMNNEKDLEPGAGLYVFGDNSTTVTVNNSIFDSNSSNASSGGGAIYVSGANLNVNGSCITNNDADYAGAGPVYGGAVSVARGATVNFTNCSFTGNSVTNSGKGGAIAINTNFSGSGTTAAVSVTSCYFSGNTATSEGNHIFLREGSNTAEFYIHECTFVSTVDDIFEEAGTTVMTNSGSPTITGFTAGNNIDPVTSASTTCPTIISPCMTILPVELISFEGKCLDKANELAWQTASEYNNAYFVLERAGMDGHFEVIEKLPGSLNSSDLLTYYYSDEHPKLGINYYRLSQVDVDGRSESFEPITVYNNCTADDLVVTYLARENSLYFSLQLEEVSGISLLNMAGQVVECLETDPRDSISKLQLKNPPGAGVYILKIDRGGMIETGKVSISN